MSAFKWNACPPSPESATFARYSGSVENHAWHLPFVLRRGVTALIRKGALVGRPILYKIAQAVRGSASRAVHAMRRVPAHHFALELLLITG
ncbi:MAG TPA: hypothetical protein VNC42_06310, partial [Bradyrhizobium sp.]|nr:hypothetical protein [Bradyrhizobium sp.]